jgi:hypothetical protein
MTGLSRHCQSCGMPRDKDPQQGGTEANGTKSVDYCSHCYQNGRFTEPNITSSEMITKIRILMERDMHLPKPVSWWFTRNIPRLKRWHRR